jgi:hypothetical protein
MRMRLGSALHKVRFTGAGDGQPLRLEIGNDGLFIIRSRATSTKSATFPQHKMFWSPWFLGGYGLFSLQRKSNLPAGESSTGHSRKSATMIESGIVETLTASGTGRVKRDAGLARGSPTISGLLCCGLEAGPDLQKIGRRAVSREGNRPLLCPGHLFPKFLISVSGKPLPPRQSLTVFVRA